MNLNTLNTVIAVTVLIAVTLLLLLMVHRFLPELREDRSRRAYWRDWRDIHYRSPEGAYADRLLVDLEERLGIRLTAGARDMLLIPIFEAQAQGRFGPPFGPIEFLGREVESLEVILRTTSEDPSLYDREGRTRSSLSVIRAFWKNFCNIPPFCDGRREG
jgi:hypothetical protein